MDVMQVSMPHFRANIARAWRDQRGLVTPNSDACPKRRTLRWFNESQEFFVRDPAEWRFVMPFTLHRSRIPEFA
jgi:hypothetical protein